jgi:hypothetical protein
MSDNDLEVYKLANLPNIGTKPRRTSRLKDFMHFKVVVYFAEVPSLHASI